MKPETRGGSREGAGRKPKEVKNITVAVSLPPATVAAIDAIAANRSRFIADAATDALAAANSQTQS